MNDFPARLREALADRYRIERPLGAGDIAMVYIAEDPKHDRKVVLNRETQLSIDARTSPRGLLPPLPSQVLAQF